MEALALCARASIESVSHGVLNPVDTSDLGITYI